MGNTSDNLILLLDAPIMLLSKLNSHGLFNSARVNFKSMMHHVPEAKHVPEKKFGRKLLHFWLASETN